MKFLVSQHFRYLFRIILIALLYFVSKQTAILFLISDYSVILVISEESDVAGYAAVKMGHLKPFPVSLTLDSFIVFPFLFFKQRLAEVLCSAHIPPTLRSHLRSTSLPLSRHHPSCMISKCSLNIEDACLTGCDLQHKLA